MIAAIGDIGVVAVDMILVELPEIEVAGERPFRPQVESARDLRQTGLIVGRLRRCENGIIILIYENLRRRALNAKPCAAEGANRMDL